MMPRYALKIEYDGSPYHGWQRQENAITIQEDLEDALSQLTQQAITLYISGRTDAGVHAHRQVAHFDCHKEYPLLTVIKGSNFYLREKMISILDAAYVDESFHARFSALARQYQYRILNRKSPSALAKNRCWHVPYELDIKEMQKSALPLLGKHDLSAFRAQNCQSKSPIKSITSINIQKIDDFIDITVKAPSFLYHQVRNMVGTFVQVGRGKWTANDVQDILVSRDRKKAGPTAPPYGLYFDHVFYETDPFSKN